MSEQSVNIAGEHLLARADGALFWPAEKTCFVADVHFGKAATFRALRVPVPVGTTQKALDRLSSLIADTGATRLVFLGDLWHAKEGRTQEIVDSLAVWRDSHKDVEMILVQGNHDRRAGALPPELCMAEVEEPYQIGPFSACHYPCECEGGYVLSGHIHPAVRLEGKGDQALKLPCFWFGNRSAVLPAFGEFTGVAVVTPKSGDRVFVIAEGQLFSVA